MKKKTKHIMAPAKRTSKTASPTENRRRAALGDKMGSQAQELVAFLKQISTAKGKVEIEGVMVEKKMVLSFLFAREIWEIFNSGDGSIFRDLADFAEVPTARPSLAKAWSMREYWQQCLDAGFTPPSIKKKKIIKAIVAETGCAERTAERDATAAGLGEVFGWKAGRPRSRF